MRASGWTRRPGAGLLAFTLVSILAAVFIEPAVAEAGAEVEPAFRLPIGGKPLAGPLLDESMSPASIWILSEDSSLYLLSEQGKLLSRTALPGKAAPFLALDSGGRALLVIDGKLSAWTRLGREAFRADLGLAADEVPLCAFGSDGRLFLAASGKLWCLSPSGRQLWSLELPGGAGGLACDSHGRILVASPAGGSGGPADGGLTVVSPRGGVEARLPEAGAVSALCAFGAGSDGGPMAAVAAAGRTDGAVLMLSGPGGSAGRVTADCEITARVQAASDAICDFATDGRILYALSVSGRVAAISPAVQLLWALDTGLKSGRLSLHAARLVVTGRGQAASLDLSGKLAAAASLRNSAAPSILSPSGLLFSPGEDWVLGAYYFEAGVGPALQPPLRPYADDSGAVDEELAYDPVITTSGGRLAFLAAMEERLDSGELGEEEGRAGAVAAAMVAGAFDKSFPAAEARFRADPLPKTRALHLLGRMGSPSRLGAIIKAFEDDPEPAVKAAACQAVAAIGLDPDGRALASFSRVAAAARLDEEAAFAVIAAVLELSLDSGSPPGLDSMRCLLSLSRRPYGQDVRNAAAKALGRLAGSLAP
jgi:hypothetical protein